MPTRFLHFRRPAVGAICAVIGRGGGSRRQPVHGLGYAMLQAKAQFDWPALRLHSVGMGLGIALHAVMVALGAPRRVRVDDVSHGQT